MSEKGKAERFEAFSVREAEIDGKKRTFWDRCGVAFVNGDHSINVVLHSFPINGKVQLRKPRPEDTTKDAGEPS